MGRTTNFGFSTFGQTGSISDNNYKFSSRDRDALDSLLWALFHHDHAQDESAGIAQLTGPNHRPVLSLASTGGTLPAGQTFYYRIAFRDSFGNETEASVQATLTTPPPISSPPVLSATVQTIGGLLGAGTYTYAFAHTQAGGLTTRAPNEFSVFVPTGTNTNQVTITLNALPVGASGWNVFRRDPASDEFYYLTSIGSGPSTFVDDGSDTLDCTRVRPTVNNTNATSSVIIAIDPLDLPLSRRVAAWRVYRTTTGGIYSSNSLIAHVTETTTEGGSDLVTSFVDEGLGAFPGLPLDQTAAPPTIPGIDAENGFDEDSGRIPARLAPWRVSQMHTFIPGEILDGTVYNQTYLYEDMTPSRIDVQFLGAPSGVDGSNHGIVRVKDNAMVNEVQAYWTDAVAENEFQQLVVAASAGTYTLTFDGQTTTAIPFDAIALDIADALIALSNITEVFVYGIGTVDDPFVVEFLNPGDQNVPQMTANVGSLTGTVTVSTEVDGSDGGTFTLSDGTSTTNPIAATATAATLKTRLETDIAAITTVVVTGAGTEEDPWIVEYTNPAATNVPLLTANISNLNGIVLREEVTRGHGNVIFDVVADDTGTYHYWAAPEVIKAKEYATDMTTTGGTEVSDTSGEIDLVVELNAQNEEVTWDVGVLDAGVYRVLFYVADQDRTAAFDVKVLDLPSTTVTSLSVTDNRRAYTPAYELEFTADGVKDYGFQVKKTDTGTDRVRVDRIEYEVLLDTFNAGGMLTVEGAVSGTPTSTGENVQVNVWY